jgi:excisionase family DNA binding protein
MAANRLFRQYPDVVMVEQLCRMLHIGKNTAYTLIKSNRIRHVRIGKLIKIPKRSVVDFVLQSGK